MLPYCPEWSLKATMEMIDLLQTNVRASVVVRNARFRSPLLRCPFFTVSLPHPGVRTRADGAAVQHSGGAGASPSGQEGPGGAGVKQNLQIM